jgi:hypothetical protein
MKCAGLLNRDVEAQQRSFGPCSLEVSSISLCTRAPHAGPDFRPHVALQAKGQQAKGPKRPKGKIRFEW